MSNAVNWASLPNLGTYPAQVSYDFTLSATTGSFYFNLAAIDPQNLSLRYSLDPSSSSLPGTLMLGSNGEISGTLTANDAGTFTVIVTDTLGRSNSETFNVAGDSGVNPIIYSLASGSFPDPNGTVTYDTTGVHISGTYPAILTNTVYTFALTAYNGLMANTQEFIVQTDYPVPSWITPSENIYTGLGDTKISQTVTVVAYSPVGRNMSYHLQNAQAVPNSIVVKQNVFSGYMPTVVTNEVYTFTMNATDGHFTIPQTFTITAEVNPYLSWNTPGGLITNVLGGQLPDKSFTTNANTHVTTYFFSSTNILAESATGPVTYQVTDGTLPPGIGIVNATPSVGNAVILNGVLNDYSAQSTSYTFEITGSTEAGYSISRQFSINVLDNTIVTDDNDFIDLYANAVCILLHFDGNHKSTIFTDTDLHTWYNLTSPGHQIAFDELGDSTGPTPVGDPGAYTSTHRALYGVSSLYCNGFTGIGTAYCEEFDFTTTDWTVECSIFFPQIASNTVTGTLFSCNSFYITYHQQQFQINYTDARTNVNFIKSFDATSIVTNTWYQLAFVRSGTNFEFFLNGEPAGYYTDGTPTFGVNKYFIWATAIGCRQTIGPPSNYMPWCYIDEFRVTRAARYNAFYLVSEYPFPNPPEFKTDIGELSRPLGSLTQGIQKTIMIIATNPYNQIVAPSNSVLFTVVNGSLPPLINLLANGLVEGTASTDTTTAGTYTFGIQVDDGINPIVREFSIIDLVNQPPIWTTKAGLLSNTVSGLPLTTTVVATDPEKQQLQYTVTSGALPPNLTLNSTSGVISGTTLISSGAAPYFFTITVNDGVNFVPRDFQIELAGNGPPTWITPGGSIAGLKSGNYLNTFLKATDVNQQPITYHFVSGTLPPGIGIASNGQIGGYVRSNVTTEYDFVANATNAFGGTLRTFSITVSPIQSPVFQSPGSTFHGLGGLVANAVIVATDPQGLPLTFSEGVPSFEHISSSGAMSGTMPNPVGGQTYPFVVNVTNQGVSCSSTFYYAVAFNYAPVWQEGPNLGNFSGGTFISIPLSAIDPEGYPVIYSSYNDTPPGLVFSNTAQTLSGTLQQATSGNAYYTFTITASDGVTPVTQTFTMTNEYSGPPLFATTNANITHAKKATAYSFTFTFKPNLISGVTTRLVSGSLPPGLTFNNGTISGTPTGTGGKFTFTLEATNSAGVTDQTFILQQISSPIWAQPNNTLLASLHGVFTGSQVNVSAVSTDGASIVTYQEITGQTYTISGLNFTAAGNPNRLDDSIFWVDQIPPNMTLNPNTGAITGILVPDSRSGSNLFNTNVIYGFTLQTLEDGVPNPLSNIQYLIQVYSWTAPTTTVTRTNYASSIAATSGYYLSGDSVTWQISATDTGGYPISFVANTTSPPLPTGLTYVDNGNGTAVLSGTIDPSQVTSNCSFVFDTVYGVDATYCPNGIRKTTTIPINVFQLTTPTWSNVYAGGNLSTPLLSTTAGSGGNRSATSLVLASQPYSGPISGANLSSSTGGHGGAANNMVVTNNSSYGGTFTYGGLSGNGQVQDFPLNLSVIAGNLPPGITLAFHPAFLNSAGSPAAEHFWALTGPLLPSSYGQTYNFTIRATLTNEAISYFADQLFTASIPYQNPQLGTGLPLNGTITLPHTTTTTLTFRSIDPNNLIDTLTLGPALPYGWTSHDNGNNTMTINVVNNSSNHAGDTYPIIFSANNGHTSNSWSCTIKLT